jgi:hypothetical protein
MAFFLQRRIQPLQAWVSKLWTYAGSTDPSRVSSQDPKKNVLNKRVRSLTTLTTKIEIPACPAPFFDSTHPLPQVRDLQSKEIFHFLVSPLTICCWCFVLQILCRTTNFWLHALLFLRKDPSMLNPPLLTPEPPRVVRTRMGIPLCRLPSLSLRLKVQRRSGNAWKTWLTWVYLIRKMYHRSKWLPRVPTWYLWVTWLVSVFSPNFLSFDLLLLLNLNNFLLAMTTSQKRLPLWFFLRQLQPL